MNKLEQYLDQVCRCIGGPRSMRQHVRQELREHLLDAIAEHQAAGLAEEAALDKALEEFGRPEEVRTELEATHGQRLLPILIDKAMQWKESTMRAKWLWTTWAHLALAIVIVLDVMFITFVVIFIIPKFQRLVQDGMISATELGYYGLAWMADFLNGLAYIGGNYTTFIVFFAAIAWGAFEWRARNENKTIMRLSALGTTAAGLTILVGLATASLVIPFTLAMPAMGIVAKPWAVEQVGIIDTSVTAMERAAGKGDWKTIEQHATDAYNACARLICVGPAITSLAVAQHPTEAAELRTHANRAMGQLSEVYAAIRETNSNKLSKALERFHSLFGPLRDAAQRPAPSGASSPLAR